MYIWATKLMKYLNQQLLCSFFKIKMLCLLIFSFSPVCLEFDKVLNPGIAGSSHIKPHFLSLFSLLNFLAFWIFSAFWSCSEFLTFSPVAFCISVIVNFPQSSNVASIGDFYCMDLFSQKIELFCWY